MAWTDASTQSAGHLVTADEWNEVINNLKYLKGEDGTVSIEGDIDPSANNSKNLGTYALQWGQIWANKLYASNGMMTVHRGTVREETFDWPSLTRADWNIIPAGTADVGNGDFDTGGTGQVSMWVLNNNVDGIYLGPVAEQNSAKDNSWNAGRSPYGRFAFSLSAAHADVSLWIGFRQTLGNAVPVAAAENFAGLYWDGTTWKFMCANGTAQTLSAGQTVAADTRHVLEILITSATSVTFALDGTVLWTPTTTLPTGDLDWTVMLLSRDTAGALTFYTTVGKLLFQESLS